MIDRTRHNLLYEPQAMPSPSEQHCRSRLQLGNPHHDIDTPARGWMTVIMLGKALETDVQTLQKGVNTDLQQAVSPAVSLTIKVPKNYRQHWQIEAKRRDTNVTKIIIDSLSKELGLPEQ